MVRIHIYCEGPSEEKFINELLLPVFAEKQIILAAIPCYGVSKYSRIRRDICSLCRNDRGAFVTTMLDYYGLPSDTPGYRTALQNDVYQRVSHVEEHMRVDMGEERFYPNLLLHEYEALLFSKTEAFSYCDLSERKLRELRRIEEQFPTPEHINNNPNTSPSKRIQAIYPAYDKVLDGYNIAKDIGLPLLREKCRHFDAWLARLETL